MNLIFSAKQYLILHFDLYIQDNKSLSIISKGRRDLRIYKYNTTADQNYYQYIAIVMFNELRNYIKLIKDKMMVKKSIKKYMLERNNN